MPLYKWDVIKEYFAKSPILLGNGLSINVWPGFAYSALKDSADLTPEHEMIFKFLETDNFEECLSVLASTARVNDIYGIPNDEVWDSHQALRDSLFAAVGKTHIPWSGFPVQSHKIISAELSKYSAVYSTSYDMSIYWSIMYDNEKGEPFKDFFWHANEGGSRNLFSADDCTLRGSGVPVYYLHGAIHLWTDDIDEGKITRGANATKGPGGGKDGISILRQALSDHPRRRPLFVSEGSSADKVRSIAGSDYLSFCLQRLHAESGNIVIFGHSLSPQDEHIVKAVASGKAKKIAVGLHCDSDAERSRIKQLFPGHELNFFDSKTHPLGGNLRSP